MRAMSTASSIVVPPSISSSPHSRTPRARRLPMTLRTAATISTSSRVRLAEAAAVVVGAPVGGRGEEAAHDRRVAALQLDAVEAALGAVLGDERVAGDDLVDLGRRDRLGHLAEQRIGDRRRRPHRQPGVHRRGLAAVVVDLGEDRDPVAVDGVGDPAVAGDDLAVEAVDQLLVRPVGRVGGVLLGDDQAGAAGGAGAVVGGVLLGRQAVAGVVREVGREHDPVAGRDGTELERGPQVAVRHGCDTRSTGVSRIQRPRCPG